MSVLMRNKVGIDELWEFLKAWPFYLSVYYETAHTAVSLQI